MHYSEVLKRALEYIETHLEENANVLDLTAEVSYSRHHFSRFFHAFTGHTPIGYIRRRKLDSAGWDLLHTEQGILEISLKYGFGSQEAFTRAFKEVTQMTPGQYRKNGLCVNIQKPLDLSRIVLVRGGIELKPVIKVIENKYFAGLVYNGLNEHQEVGQLWQTFNQRCEEIKNAVNDGNYYGLCEPIEEDAEDLDFENLGEITYMAGIEVTAPQNLPEGMVHWHIEKQTYAVFTHVGDVEALPETYKLIFSKWLPESGYEAVYGIDFELYDRRFRPGDVHSELDIYVPIKI